MAKIEGIDRSMHGSGGWNLRAAAMTAAVLGVLAGSAVAQELQVVDRYGQWATIRQVDPMFDDSVQLMALTEIGDAQLILTCDTPDSPSLLFLLDNVYVDGRTKTVRFRVDKNEPVRSEWLVVSSGSKAGLGGQLERATVESLREGGQIIIRTWSAASVSETRTFSLAGFTAASAPVLEACSWATTAEVAERAAKTAAEVAKTAAEVAKTAAEVAKRKAERLAEDRRRHVAYNETARDDALRYELSEEFEAKGTLYIESVIFDSPLGGRRLSTTNTPTKIDILRRLNLPVVEPYQRYQRRGEAKGGEPGWFFVKTQESQDLGWVKAESVIVTWLSPRYDFVRRTSGASLTDGQLVSPCHVEIIKETQTFDQQGPLREWTGVRLQIGDAAEVLRKGLQPKFVRGVLIEEPWLLVAGEGKGGWVVAADVRALNEVCW